MDGNGDDAATANSSRYQAEGLCYMSRLEITPVGDWAIKPKDYKESYAGTSGKGWMMGLELGYNQHDTDTTAGTERGRWRDTLVLGAETLLHVEGLSLLAEYRWARQTINTDQGNPNLTSDASQYAHIYLIQAGYAMRCPIISGAVVEPAFRITRTDTDREDTNESGNFGDLGIAAATANSDYATSSGTQYDLGINWYLSGAGKYSNKVSLLWTHWLAEDSPAAGSGDYKPKADIVRVQYQWLF